MGLRKKAARRILYHFRRFSPRDGEGVNSPELSAARDAIETELSHCREETAAKSGESTRARRAGETLLHRPLVPSSEKVCKVG